MKAAAVFARVLFCLAFVAGGGVAPAVALTTEELAEFKQKAEQGDVQLQKLLGYSYRYGKNGIEKDETEAAKWYRLASDQGDSRASNSLGEMYFNGEGVEKDETEGVKWFRLALKQGHNYAQFMLAKAYEEGRGVEKDEAEAVKRYRLAAAQGVGEAEHRVGLMYEEGKVFEKDEVEAFKFFRRAGWRNAGKELFEIFHPAAERGEAYPQYEIGYAYFYGDGVEKDEAEGLKWLRLAAEQGYVEAQYMLGVIYDKSRGEVEEDDAVAVKWYRRAAKQGHAESQNRLGLMYSWGYGVPSDQTEAIKWIRRAADKGYVDAMRNVGDFYALGLDGSENLPKAIKWYRRVAERGSYRTQAELGERYFNGNGVAQNYREAYIMYSLYGSGKKDEAKSAKAKLTAAQIESADEEVRKITERNQKRREEEEEEKAEEEAALEWRRANVVPDLRRKGDAYYKGKGVLPNYKEAAKWYLQAAERGDAEAQYRLGLMYAEGKRGIEQNHVEAYIWLALAGVNDTGEIGDKAASLRESVEKSLTAEQFEQAQAEATERLEKIKAKQ